MSNRLPRSASRITGTTRPFGVSAAKPIWKYFLKHEILTRRIERGVESRKLLESHDACPHDEGQRRQANALLFRLGLERDTRDIQIRDVRLVVLRDVRHIDPACLQPRAGNALDARQRLNVHGAEFREVDFRHLGQRPAAAPAPEVSSAFTYAFTSSWVMRDFGPLPEILPRSAPSSRANLRTEGLA